jgi:hypothetical protein
MRMSQDVTNGLVSGGQGGHMLEIFPAYAQDGVMFARVFQGTTDAAIFEDLIEQLLCHCGRYSEPKSVIIMDNASFHHTKRAVVSFIAVCWRDHLLLKSLHCSKGFALPWTKGTTALGLDFVAHASPSEREEAIL